ncbi:MULTISPECIES: serine/threonine-protein kinase [unclassified Streptomyces]|uniref:serine/threonine-protein kinase n=1 Tax=unclassified Streptomyces TaxID=2593676 RepID=UPI003324A18D
MTDQRPASPYTPASGEAALRHTGAAPLRTADPARIGPYVPLGLLGSGGMGRVYLARPADDRPGLAAVKVIRPEYAEDPEFRRRFEREASVQARIRTAYAPRLLGTGFEESVLWMATQFLPGLNLAEAVRDCGTLEPAGVWRLVAELGRALSALSDDGVVHRDLKPSNVILSPSGAHVIDFGISRAVDSSAITGTGSRVGTPAFMSPEYLREGRCDTASDVFSLAGTLVYAATAHAPFGDGTGVDVMHRVAFEDPRPEVMAELSSVDAGLAALLSACLTKDPADRPTSRQLIDAATAAGHGHASGWQEPLGARLLALSEGCAVLEGASARQTGHFRTPTERVSTGASAPASAPSPVPAPGPGFGPPTPPGAYGPAAYGPYGSPTPPGQYDSAASASAPAPAVTGSGAHERRGRKKPYLVVTAVLAVCAVAAGGFLLTRTPLDETAAPATPSASAGAPGADDGRPSSLPGAATSPSGKEEKGGDEKGGDEKKDDGKDGEEEEGEGEKDAGAGGAGQGGDRGSGGAPGDAPAPERTSGAGGSAGDTGSDGGQAAAPTATVTETASEPAAPAWISGCSYYSGTAIVRYGDTGQRVVQAQCMLTKRGYGVGRAGVDGQFGEDTVTAVKRFQRAKGLQVDGEVGPRTWAALRRTT